LPIVNSMSGFRAEPRTAIIAQVEVSWEEQDGTAHEATARIEDKSPSGACIRVKAPMNVGSKLKIKWRWEEYLGIAKYCRSDGMEYLLGIQRVTKDQIQAGVLKTAPLRESAASNLNPLSKPEIPSGPNQQEGVRVEISLLNMKTRELPIVPGAHDLVVMPPMVGGNGADTQDSPGISHAPGGDAPEGTVLQALQLLLGEERTPMSTKWLDQALKRQKQDAPNGKTNGSLEPGDWTPAEAPPADKISANYAAKGITKPQGDLQSMEDIYRAAGIMNPRMGYSIRKVVEMLNSEHVRGLSSDAKRAAVLMALDAAGITMDEVLRDARVRQSALDAYECDQRKHFEGYWARKVEGNALIQVEMERITAQSLDRIKRNQDEVAMEKAAFAEWQKTKQQEAERISEAVALCSKLAPGEPPGASLLSVRGPGAIAKPS
jgi:hypothetical protein